MKYDLVQKYQEVEKELINRRGSSDNPRKKVREVLDKLGSPDEDYKVILVGGSNGKGSTVEMISELLHHQGYRVGVSKSPHLTSVRDRIRIGDERISREKFVELYSRVTETEPDLSFFECITVISYLYYRDKDVDFAVIEIGKGGLRDSKNAAEAELGVITNVEKEHTDLLGEKIEDIGERIAGISPRNGYLITDQDLQSIKRIAKAKNSSIKTPAEVQLENEKYRYNNEEFEIPLIGSFQRENLEKAIKAVQILGEVPKNLGNAFSGLESPGRMETISEEPLYIMDGAHNVPALERVIEDLPEKFICIFNCTKNSRTSEMLEILEKKTEKFYFTDSGFFKSEEPSKIAEKAEKQYEIIKNPLKAEKRALNEAKTQKIPVVTIGSLYLIGNLKKRRKE